MSAVSAVVSKKKRIINIQLKPDNVRSSMHSINYPETTKEQASKSFEKLKNKQTKKRDSVLRPKTAAGIMRVSVDDSSTAVNESQNQPR